MEFELWWLLPIPALFFALGWIAARIDIKHLLRESRALPLVVFPRPQLPAERAARQGDRIVHRGGQGRPADGRSAFRAGQPVPPPGRDRPRDPHAPEPARPSRPSAGQAAATAVFELGAGLPPRGTARSRRGALHASSTARRSSIAALGHPAADLRAGEGLAEGDRRDPAHGGARQAAVLQGDRALLLRAGAGGAAALAIRRRRARIIDAGAGRIPGLRAGDDAARRPRSAAGRLRGAIAAWQRIESQNPGVPRARRRAARRRVPTQPATSRRARACCAATGAVSFARSAQRGVHADARARGRRARRRS